MGPGQARRRRTAAPPQALANLDDGIKFEQIAALRPDLILAVYTDMSRSEYDTLTGIAPTVAQPAEFVDLGVPWQELTRTVAGGGLPGLPATGPGRAPPDRPGVRGTGGDRGAGRRRKFGTTEIPTEPRRVACVGGNEQDALLAVGVIPIATARGFGANYPGGIGPWAQDELGMRPCRTCWI